MMRVMNSTGTIHDIAGIAVTMYDKRGEFLVSEEDYNPALGDTEYYWE